MQDSPDQVAGNVRGNSRSDGIAANRSPRLKAREFREATQQVRDAGTETRSKEMNGNA